MSHSRPEQGNAVPASPTALPSGALASLRTRWRTDQPWRFWRSPADQPAGPGPRCSDRHRARRPRLRLGHERAYLEPFYGGAARSMSHELARLLLRRGRPVGHRLGRQAARSRSGSRPSPSAIFGFHVWALVLPQVVEGVLTVLVLYRAVRRVAGAGAGIVAALVMAVSPIVILLDRGNISDSLLILLLVLAADATIRACQSGRLRSLVWAGVLVGLAFQAKMLQAWLVLPALFVVYLVAAPIASFLRRVGHLAAGHAGRRRRVAQLDVRRLPRAAVQPALRRRQLQRLALHPGVLLQRVQPPRRGARRHGGVQPAVDLPGRPLRGTRVRARLRHLRHRRVVGPPAAGSLRPRRRLVAPAGGGGGACGSSSCTPPSPRTDPRAGRGAPVVRLARADLRLLQRRPVLELLLPCRADPPVAALCGMGAAGRVGAPAPPRPSAARLGRSHGGHRRRHHRTRPGLRRRPPLDRRPRPWWSGSSPSGSCRLPCAPATIPSGPSASAPPLAAAAMLLGSAWASAAVVQARLGPFDSPYAPVAVNRFSQEAAYDVPVRREGTPGRSSPTSRRTRPPTSSRPRARPATPSWPPGASSSPSAGSPGACPPVAGGIQAVRRRGPRPTGDGRRPSPLTNAPPTCAGWCRTARARPGHAATTPFEQAHHGPSTSARRGTRPALAPARPRPARRPRHVPSPARRKSRNCVTRMKRMMPRPTAGTCWRCGSVTSSGSRQLVLLAAG